MRTIGLIAAFSLLVATGCNESKQGAEGNIIFTPDECGGHFLGCDFDDSVGVGGKININIRGNDGFSTAGVTLYSDDTSVLAIEAIGDVGGRPTWEATGIAPGVARVTAIDTNQEDVDFLEVGVQTLSGLTLDNFLGNATGPVSDATYDEAWQVNANEDTSFWVTPLIGTGVPTMGRYEYTETQDLDPGYMLTNNDPINGYLAFNAPEGTYTFEFTNDQTDDTLSVVIDAVGQ